MGHFTLTHDPHGQYCGFDRHYTVLATYACGAVEAQDYMASDGDCSWLIDGYTGQGLASCGIRLIHIGDDVPASYRDNFRLIGWDCGYLLDAQTGDYVGFSTIANEVMRMDNALHTKHRCRLNAHGLFQIAEHAVAYGKERNRSLPENPYQLENAFDGFAILPIHLYRALR